MLTLIIVLVLAAAVAFVLMKKGKITDANNNNIPDAIENKVAEVKAEVKEVAEKVKNVAPKKQSSKKPVAKKSK